jgi:5-methylcytosine-specific restriction protein B
MAAKRAIAAAYWSYTLSNFKALYGRGGGGYTKDFIQVKFAVRDQINKIVGFDGAPVMLDIKWPGGSHNARWDNKEGDADGDARGQLRVRDGAGAAKTMVEPWRVGDPLEGVTSIAGDPGNPEAVDPDAANAVHQNIVISNTRPWLVAVFLEGEPQTLYARSYLTNPPVGLEHRSVDTLPAALRDAIMRANARELARAGQKMSESGFVRLETPLRAEKIVRQIDDALAYEPNVLLVGPPGCGKTVALEDLESRYREAAFFDPDLKSGEWSTAEHGKAMRLVFYPAFSYDNFVAGLAPKGGVGINLEPRPGPLLNMVNWCSDGDRDGMIMIDEINRGPAAAIFGDMLGLLDGSKRSSGDDIGQPISRPHSDRDMEVPAEFADQAGGRLVPPTLALPASLKIVGAYNSTDRSITPLDMAFTRRFRTIRVGPDADVLARQLEIEDQLNDVARVYVDDDFVNYTVDDVKRLAVELMRNINARIEVALGPDFEIGHALFWKVAGVDLASSAASLSSTFQDQVIPTMEKAFLGKAALFAAVLNVPEEGEKVGSAIGSWVAAPGKLRDLLGSRFVLSDLKSLPTNEQLRALRSVVLD